MLGENKEKGICAEVGQDELITLDIGGITYRTRKETLCAFPDSVLGTIGECRDEASPSIFIDRDGNAFRFVLNYIRDKERVVLPDQQVDLAQVKAEADYYHLPGLSKLVLAQIEAINASKQPAPVMRVCYDCNNRLDVEVHGSLYCEHKYHPGPVQLIAGGEKDDDYDFFYTCCGADYDPRAAASRQKAKRCAMRYHRFG